MSTPPNGLKYIKQASVRRIAKQYNRRVSVAFLLNLDNYVRAKVESIANNYDDGRKTIGPCKTILKHTHE